MYVWSDGQNHRISVVGGIAHCQLYEAPWLDESHRMLLIREMVSSGCKMLDRGLRPLGMILDLRRSSPMRSHTTQVALQNLLDRWDRARLPTAVLLSPGGYGIEVYLPPTRAANAPVFTSLLSAEAWVRPSGPRTASL